jgi:hypothetical protein
VTLLMIYGVIDSLISCSCRGLGATACSQALLLLLCCCCCCYGLLSWHQQCVVRCHPVVEPDGSV